MSSLLDKKQKGQVFNVQKYSVHDGPGIRTIVFLKGCSLGCAWCSNPESQKLAPELAYNEGRCQTVAKCKHCISVCPHQSLKKNDDDFLELDRTHCDTCAKPCAEVCPSQGLLVYGQEKTVDDVLKSVEQDMLFYSRSGGGMTLSGGEPLFQKDFSLSLLREARKRRIKTCIETCGMVPWENMNQASEFLNYVIFDIKHINSEKHKEFTHAGNERILENFANLAKKHPEKEILCRTPIIPGFNNTEDDIRDICNFIKEFPNVKYEMLPYHRLGTQKYIFLDKEVPMGDVQLDISIMPKIVKVAREILGVDRVVVASS